MFDVFLSYRRKDGSRVARRLRRRLLDYRLPPACLGDEPQRPLQVYLDTMYERADEDFFNGTIVPALRQSRRLIVVNTPGAREPRQDGKPSWVEREIGIFRGLPHGGNVSVVAGRGNFDDPLPAGLGTHFGHMEIIDLRRLDAPVGLMAWADPRVDAEVRKLIATLYDVPPAQMPLLHREDEQRRRRTLFSFAAAATIVILLLTGLLVATVRSQRAAERAERDAVAALEQSRVRLADSLSLLARRARENGDPLAAIAYVSEARRQASTALTLAQALALERPMLAAGRTLNGGRTAGVMPVAFVPGTHRIVAGTYDGSLQLYDGDSGALIAATEPAGLPVTAIAASREVLVAALRTPADVNWSLGEKTTGRLDLWKVEAATLRLVRSIPDASCLALAVDAAATVAVCATDWGVTVWPLATAGAARRVLDSFTRMTSIAVSPDGRYAAAGSIRGTIRVYDLATAKIIREMTLAPPRGRIYEMNAMGVAFSPDGTLLASGWYDRTVRLWGVRDVARDAALAGHTAAVHVVAFSADGTRVLSGSWDGTGRLWDIASRRALAVVRADGAIVIGVAWSDDGARAATVESVPTARGNAQPGLWRFGRLRVWAAAPSPRIDVAISDPRNVVRLTFDDRNRLSIWSAGARLRVDGESGSRSFDVEALPFVATTETVRRATPIRIAGAGEEESAVATGEIVSRVPGPAPRLLGLDTSRDGTAVAICVAVPAAEGDRFQSASVRVLDRTTGKLRTQLALGDEIGAAGPVRLSPDGTTVAVAYRHPGPGGGELLLWDTQTGASRRFSGEGGAIATLAFSADGRLLAEGSDDEPVLVRNVAVGTTTELRLDVAAAAPLLAFDPNGKWLAAATLARFLVWDLATKTSRSIAVPSTFMPSAIALSPDGRLMAAGTATGEVELWDVARGERLEVLRPHDSVVAELAFSPDGSRLASLSGAGVRISGAIVPRTSQETMRLTRLTVRDAAIDPLP